METLKQKSVETQENSIFSLLANFGFTEEQLLLVFDNPAFCKRAAFVADTPNVSTEFKKSTIENILTKYVSNILFKQDKEKVETPKEVPAEAPEEEKKPKRNRKCSGSYVTNNRMKILAVLLDQELGLKDIALKTGLSERRLRDSVNSMLEQGQVLFTVGANGKKIWKLSPLGILCLQKYALTYLQCDIQKLLGNTYCKNVTPLSQKLLLQIELLQKNSKELKNLGFYAPFIPKIFKKFSPAYIKEKIDYVKSRTDLENLGAFLNSLFFPKENKVDRVVGVIKKVLNSVSQEVKEVFFHLTHEISFKKSLHLAYALRKIHNKNNFVAVSDVHGVLNWIRKRNLGATIQRC